MLLNLRQASRRFKIPVPTLRQYIKESDITITIYRGSLRVELKDLERIIKDREGPGEKKC